MIKSKQITLATKLNQDKDLFITSNNFLEKILIKKWLYFLSHQTVEIVR